MFYNIMVSLFFSSVFLTFEVFFYFLLGRRRERKKKVRGVKKQHAPLREAFVGVSRRHFPPYLERRMACQGREMEALFLLL